MRLSGKLKHQKLNKNIFKDIQKLATKIKAGYPDENPQSHAPDKNGYSATEKAYKINFTDINFVPYMQISYESNKIKYQKRFINIAKNGNRNLDKKLNQLGAEMVEDIKHTLAGIQHSPISTAQGCIYGALSFKRFK